MQNAGNMAKKDLQKNQQSLYTKDRQFKLGTHAIIATQSAQVNNMENQEDFSMIVRQISIDKLAEESKRLNPNSKMSKIDKNHN